METGTVVHTVNATSRAETVDRYIDAIRRNIDTDRFFVREMPMSYKIWVLGDLFASTTTRAAANVSLRWAALEGVPSMTITKEA